MKRKSRKTRVPSLKKKVSVEVHPWRECPAGKHWVRTFPRKVEVSPKRPDGITMVEGHCRSNPSHKDQLYPDEMKKIVREHFNELTGPPVDDDLDFPNGNA